MYPSSSIICTLGTTFCISDDRLVYIFGDIDNYISFNDNNIKTRIPRLIKGLCDIKMIDCGYGHILCLNFYGSVFSFGDNNYGQLGIDKNNEYSFFGTNIPQKIDIPPCKQIACGDYFSVCLTENNLLYSFGKNNYGQLGLDSGYSVYNSPLLIPNLHNIEYIACGDYRSICKTYNNTYYGWGSNYHGQLSHDEYMIYNKPTLCNKFPDNIISIKCGANHTLLLTLEGNIYSFGKNDYGQLGLNDNDIKKTNTPTLIRNIPEIRRIECGSDHSMCIDVNNNLWFFGNNDDGQLGLGDDKNRSEPTKHPTLSNIMDISSGGSCTFIKTLDGKIFSFGYNGCSELGIKTSEDYQLTPIQAFQDNEDIWGSFIDKSKQKSARK